MLLAVLCPIVIDDVCRHKAGNDVIKKVECINELVVRRDDML